MTEQSLTDYLEEYLRKDETFNTLEEDEQFKYYRQMAKGITFGTIYGMGAKNLAHQLSTTVKEASR